MEKEFLEDFAVVVAGGDTARALVAGEGEIHFDEWFSMGNSAEEREMREFAKNNAQLITVVAAFALEDDERLKDNSLWLLSSLELGKTAPESVVNAARLGLKAAEFRCRMHAAGLVASIQDEVSYPEARRILIDILVKEEFDDWEAVSAAAETFRELGRPSEEDLQRLKAVMAGWSNLVKTRGGDIRRMKPDDVHHVWDMSSCAADYLGLRKPGGEWWEFKTALDKVIH